LCVLVALLLVAVVVVCPSAWMVVWRSDGDAHAMGEEDEGVMLADVSGTPCIVVVRMVGAAAAVADCVVAVADTAEMLDDVVPYAGCVVVVVAAAAAEPVA
jgi:hypothetical protein